MYATSYLLHLPRRRPGRRHDRDDAHHHRRHLSQKQLVAQLITSSPFNPTFAEVKLNPLGQPGSIRIILLIPLAPCPLITRRVDDDDNDDDDNLAELKYPGRRQPLRLAPLSRETFSTRKVPVFCLRITKISLVYVWEKVVETLPGDQPSVGRSVAVTAQQSSTPPGLEFQERVVSRQEEKRVSECLFEACPSLEATTDNERLLENPQCRPKRRWNGRVNASRGIHGAIPRAILPEKGARARHHTGRGREKQDLSWRKFIPLFLLKMMMVRVPKFPRKIDISEKVKVVKAYPHISTVSSMHAAKSPDLNIRQTQQSLRLPAFDTREKATRKEPKPREKVVVALEWSRVVVGST
ncbi:hypothetical protein Fcan01_19384 [Folsomia candida]|uniref:Uncharacterized protein n=1 Tax=Folsomia candida TaxID=158441 RepID=A0A226DKY5_FOLCA|nr:hypothetical protein Fcan01_19384 [Folsomia candida]